MKPSTSPTLAADDTAPDEAGKSRTTISLPPDIFRQGNERRKARRAANFSNYIEILIAEDIERSREVVPA